MTTIQIQLPLQTSTVPPPVNVIMVPLTTGQPVQNNNNHINVLHMLIYVFSIMVLTSICYRFWPEIVDVYNTVVHSREHITSNDIIYSPVTNFTKKTEETIVKDLQIRALDVVYTVPSTIGNLTHLETLSIGFNPIRSLPESVGNISSLKDVYITNTFLRTLPKTIGNITTLRTLNLPNNRISNLPESIGSLENLEMLNLASNDLSSLPLAMGKLSKLEVLDLTGNKFTSFPTVLPPHLQALYIGDNPISVKELETAQIRYN